MKYKIFLLAAFFSLDSAAMRYGINQTARVNSRDEHDDVVLTAPADDTIDLRAIYREAILDRDLNNFNFLLRQDSNKLENIYHDINIWNVFINNYNLENNSFNYHGLFADNSGGIAQLNLSEGSLSELIRFLFTHKSVVSGASVDSLYENLAITKDSLVKRFANTENSVLLFYEIYNPLINIVCGFISLSCLAIAGIVLEQQTEIITTIDKKYAVSCSSVVPTSKIILNSLGLTFMFFVFFGEVTTSWIKNKCFVVDNEYRNNITQAAEKFALYLVLMECENIRTVGVRWSPEYGAMQAGISAWRTNSKANIVEVAVERLS